MAFKVNMYTMLSLVQMYRCVMFISSVLHWSYEINAVKNNVNIITAGFALCTITPKDIKFKSGELSLTI